MIEAFRLLKKIYADKDSFPFLEWWGYNNVVWQRKEELPIIIGLLFDIEGYDVYFETNFYISHHTWPTCDTACTYSSCDSKDML